LIGFDRTTAPFEVTACRVGVMEPAKGPPVRSYTGPETVTSVGDCAIAREHRATAINRERYG
jgi:hypothetical protein